MKSHSSGCGFSSTRMRARGWISAADSMIHQYQVTVLSSLPVESFRFSSSLSCFNISLQLSDILYFKCICTPFLFSCIILLFIFIKKCIFHNFNHYSLSIFSLASSRWVDVIHLCWKCYVYARCFISMFSDGMTPLFSDCHVKACW